VANTYKQQLHIVYVSSNNGGHLITKTITTLRHFATLHHTSLNYTSLNLSTLHFPHLHLTTHSFGWTHLHFLSFYFTSKLYITTSATSCGIFQPDVHVKQIKTTEYVPEGFESLTMTLVLGKYLFTKVHFQFNPQQ